MEARRAETRSSGLGAYHDSPARQGVAQIPIAPPGELAQGTTRSAPAHNRPLARNQRRIFSKVNKPTTNVSAWAELRTARQSAKARSAVLTMFSASIRVNCRPML